MSSCQLAGCGYLSHLPWHFSKRLLRLIGTDTIINFPTRISTNGTPSLLDLIFINFPENIFCSSSAPIGSSDHVLVKVDISLAVIRELSQHRRVCHFAQADWQGLQAAIKILDWSPIATFSNINSSWEFFQRNLFSLMHRFIPSRLQLSYPSSHPWFTEACGEAVGLKQLAFASGKANQTEGNPSSFHHLECPSERAKNAGSRGFSLVL